MKNKKNQKKKIDQGFKKRKLIFSVLSNLLIGIGVLIILLIFGRPLSEEIKYNFNRIFGIRYQLVEKINPQNPEKKSANVVNGKREIIPESTDFGIVIPKINANAKIFPNVDPYNSKEFLPVLKKGVAHAKGTFFPGGGKNIYLFAHSTDAFFNAGRYNAVFYLIGKLEKGDEIDIFYRGKLFKYSVFEKKVVPPGAVKYLEPVKEEILTLQTCYPPGTTLERLIVRAQKI